MTGPGTLTRQVNGLRQYGKNAGRWGRFGKLAQALGLEPKTATPHTPVRRRLLDGRLVPRDHPFSSWEEIVAPGPLPTGGAKADPKHPSRKHDGPPRSVMLTPASQVSRGLPGVRRRDRRPALIAAAKASRKQARR